MSVPRLLGMPREKEAAIIWTPSKGHIEQRQNAAQPDACSSTQKAATVPCNLLHDIRAELTSAPKNKGVIAILHPLTKPTLCSKRNQDL